MAAAAPSSPLQSPAPSSPVKPVQQPTTPLTPGSPPAKRQRITEVDLDVDVILDQLLLLKTRHASSQSHTFDVEVLKLLCTRAREIFAEQDMLLELEAPLHLCGDIHGQFHDLLRIFEHCGAPPQADYLFLGDYVDRGRRSLETIIMLFAYKVKYTDNFFLLRGNHETPAISRIYGFYDECKRRYSVGLWKVFMDVFNCLPVCAVIDRRIICMHGGLSDQMLSPGQSVIEQIKAVPRPADIPDCGFLCDLLWSDPSPEVTGFHPNDRGVSVQFGVDVVHAFLHKEDMDLVVRAHQVVEDGYEFFADRRLVTLFSAPNYCGEFDNAAAVLAISEQLKCMFTVLKPNQIPVV
eukprot:TRINITY_DN2517_c0_g1_i2.p1 TRINITY_DN2517_c0_g1~~TRINITY_DN2517_c0_g1_i2.p1  ORF type:complete len:350 (+),score=74.35 TRINITY_DN2517_c0_g1_i2:155-1204(+)